MQQQFYMNSGSLRNSTLLLPQQKPQTIEISFSIKELNCSCKIYLVIFLQKANQPRQKILRTKAVSLSYNNRFNFSQKASIEFKIQIKPTFFVEIYKQFTDELLGSSGATMGQIIRQIFVGVEKDIVFQEKRKGLIKFLGQRVQEGLDTLVISFELVARNIDVGPSFLCFGYGECFWTLQHIKPGKQGFVIHTSQSKSGKDNNFLPTKFQIRTRTNANNQQFVFKFWNDDSQPSLIGQVKTTLQNFSREPFTLINNLQKKGRIVLKNYQQALHYSLADYLIAGMQMAMVVCIDFTESNISQKYPNSLHYVTSTKKSQYEEALYQVCNIVLDYDADKLVPTYGFGAKVNMPTFKTGENVHNCFPINGNLANPNLFQLSGIMEGYRNALPYLVFSGPTYFAPLLKQAIGTCEKMKKQTKQYMILLILTDGVINDFQEVVDLLIGRCEELPLSIIIIGIGNQDFSQMRKLDDGNDERKLTDSYGNKSKRDLVKFVEFSKQQNGVTLANEVLQELPRHVEKYHQLIKLAPSAYKKQV